MKASASRVQDSSALHSQAEKSRILALAKKKYDAFMDESSALTEVTTKYTEEILADPEKFCAKVVG